MREIKFRAWDQEDKEMILLENSGLQYFDFEGSYSLGFTVDAYSGFWAHEQYESATQKSDRFPIMQFTGVEDMNGKEIYEGDIVILHDSNGFKSVIEYYKNGFYLNDFIHSNWSGEDVEVIGNIYANPELIPA